MQNTNHHFTIRVYGIIINDQNEILLEKATYKDIEFVKFPGGGLQWGEGTIDALRRELKEELNAEIADIRHLYTTDFFQISAFDPNVQVISIYYLAQMTNQDIFNQLPKSIPFDVTNQPVFFKYPLKNLTPATVTLPIDKFVVENFILRLK